MEAMRVLLVDDNTLFRKGLASLISSRQNLTIVGEARDGMEAVELARATKPDVILMDVYMPTLNGLEALKTLNEEMPNIAVVMLTISDDDETLFQAVRNGAKGYLLKNMEPEDLDTMLDKIGKGEAAIPGDIAAKIILEISQPPVGETPRPRRGDKLTPREAEVLQEIIKGLSNKDIAAILEISEYTVKLHSRNIMEKLHLRNRTQLAVHAARMELVNDANQPNKFGSNTKGLAQLAVSD